MGSRGYQRQWRRARAQLRPLYRAHFEAELSEAVAERVEPVRDTAFAGLDGLLFPVKRKYPFDEMPSEGTVGGLSRVSANLRAVGFIVIPNDMDRAIFGSRST